jgi:LPPG:FO 2-phospho-L-lactate transferase
MAAQGLPVSIAGVAEAYEDFLDILIADVRDVEAAKKLDHPGLRVHCTNTIMRTADDKTKLARTVLALLSAENARAADPS